MSGILRSDLNQRVRVLQDIGRYREAVGLLEAATAESPEDDQILCALAFNYSRLGDRERALKCAERAVAANPSNEWALRLRSSLLRRGRASRGAGRAAIRDAEAAVRIAPQEKLTWFTLAESHLNAGQIDAAERAAQELRRIAPNWSLTYHTLARIALRRSRFRAAEEYAQEALRLDPSASAAMVLLGTAQRGRAQRYEAIETLYRAATMNPQDTFTRNRFVYEVWEFCSIWTVGNLIGGLLAMMLTGGLLCVIFNFNGSLRNISGAPEFIVLTGAFALCPLLGGLEKAKYGGKRWRRLPDAVRAAYTAEIKSRRRAFLSRWRTARPFRSLFPKLGKRF